MRFVNFLVLLTFSSLMAAAPALASDKAEALRKTEGLSPFQPLPAFLGGYFLADELNPTALFGTVGEFAAARPCKTAWLIENSERERRERLLTYGKPFEFSVVLEEDCGERVTHYVFVDEGAIDPKQWVEWRRQFHMGKAAPTFGVTAYKLEKAISQGYPVSGELRFVAVNGEVVAEPLEGFLTAKAKSPPSYVLEAGPPPQAEKPKQ